MREKTAVAGERERLPGQEREGRAGGTGEGKGTGGTEGNVKGRQGKGERMQHTEVEDQSLG